MGKIKSDPRNANKGTDRGRAMIESSIRETGAGRSIVLDREDRIIAGNKTFSAANSMGLPIRVVETDGNELIAVKRIDLDIDDDAGKARRLAYYDNRTSEVGLSWDAEQILADVQSGIDLSAFWQGTELDALLATVTGNGDLLGGEKNAKPNTRRLPIDVIFCWSTGNTSCCLAVRAGWLYGVRSSDIKRLDRMCPVAAQMPRHKVQFVDNEFKFYDHSHHLEIVRTFRPKYATVRDIMTPEQCKSSGIDYYPFEQIMGWADELQEYAENVIVIPKYDCLDKIPPQFMLGYSVPTSYGGTPLPVEMFKGRRVHLLGGSWKAQLAHMAVLGDDVVSLDNNHISVIANQWGQFCDKDGETRQMSDLGFSDLSNVWDSAMCLSFGNIAAKIHDLYPVTVNQGENG